MNLDDLFSAIGTADETQLAHSEKPMKKLGIWIALAACLALILTVALLVRPERTASLLTTSPPAHHISTEKISWVTEQTAEHSGESGLSAMIMEEAATYNQFLVQMSVEAKVIGMMPDVYAMVGSNGASTRYHILQLQVLDTVIGENMPDTIYYLLPTFLSTDLAGYDCLIIAVRQLGCENYLMINESQGRAETFSFLFECGSYDPDQGGVLAFKDGKPDMGLWKKKGWNTDKEGLTPEYLLSDRCGQYPGKLNRDPEQTKQAILEKYNARSGSYMEERKAQHKVRTYASMDWQAARELIGYVAPFENGIFSQDAWRDDYITYNRVINGLPTNEYYTIYPENKTVTPSATQFTEEDLQQLPDVNRVMQTLNRSSTRTDRETGRQLIYCGISGQYRKTADGIYGILVATWGNPSYEPSRLPSCVVFSSIALQEYYLINPDGTWQQVTQEELNAVTGY